MNQQQEARHELAEQWQRLLTVDDVAERLHVSRTTVYRLVESRRLRSYRIGRQIRFNKSDIDSYLAARAWPQPATPREYGSA